MHGLQQQFDAREARQQAVVGLAVEVGEIEPGAEMAAGARQHQQPHVGIVRGRFHGLGQCLHQRGRQRIADLRPVQLQVQHMALAPSQQFGVAHGSRRAHRLGDSALE